MLEPLVQRTVYAVGAGEIGVRQLANVAYGAALSTLKCKYSLDFFGFFGFMLSWCLEVWGW